jgi:prepilin-type N-terminal cleavage/methylation domain-containing protein
MKHVPTSRSGFSLIELLVVLAIVAALAIAGVYTMGGRPNAAVRSTLDEIEGTIMGAQKLASATGKDVYLVADGVWDPTAANYFILAYDIVKPADVATNPTNPSLWPAAARTRIIANARTPQGNTNDPAGVFQLTFNPTSKSMVRDQMYSGVVIGASSWVTTALGGVTDLPSTTVGATPTFAPALTAGNRLCQGHQFRHGERHEQALHQRLSHRGGGHPQPQCHARLAGGLSGGPRQFRHRLQVHEFRQGCR